MLQFPELNSVGPPCTYDRMMIEGDQSKIVVLMVFWDFE